MTGREASAAAEDLSWVPPGVDIGKASIARVYDCLLGGTHNVQADRDAVETLIALEPNSRAIIRANRDFLARAVRFLAAAGVRQFLDIGSGIPTQGNVHEIAREAAAGARVVYMDIDPVAVTHSKAILAGEDGVAALRADLRDPEQILASLRAGQLIDPAEPVGLLLVAVLHFLPDAEDPWSIVGTLRDALPAGSYLAVSHGTDESRPELTAAAEKVYNQAVAAQATVRSRAAIERFFGGFEIVPPGVVFLPEWRPAPGAGALADPGAYWALAGVGRKP